MAASSVLRVPDEIWCQVFLHLQGALDDKEWYLYGLRADTSGFASLTSLCLACRRFKRLAQPLLYRTALLEGTDDDDVRFERFGRALLANPQLGGHIRTFAAADTTDFLNGIFYQSPGHRLALPQALLQACKDDSLHGWACSNAVFCLALMPNLELLDLTFRQTPLLSWMLSGRLDMELDGEQRPFRRKDPGSGEVISTGNIASPAFGSPRLRELRLKYGGNEGAEPITHLEPILLHPGIATLRLLGINWLGETADEMQWSEIPSNVRVLELCDCLFDAKGIENMLRRFPKLKSLAIRHGDVRRAMQTNVHWDVRLDEIGQSIRTYGQNLVELSIHTEDHAWSHELLGSLQNLHSLRHLKVLKDALTGRSTLAKIPKPGTFNLRDVLPRSLKTLYLYYDKKHHFTRVDYDIKRREKIRDELCELAVGGEFPQLHEIRVEGFTMDLEPLKQNIEGWTYSVTEDVRVDKRVGSTGRRLPVMTLSKSK